jgi:DNA-binding transcriptional ArsR family regulator
VAESAKSGATPVPAENGPSSVAPSGHPALSDVGRGVAASRSRDLDKLIHERVRLGIVSALAVNDSLTFTELRRILGTSDGNLSVHARKLEEGGYVTCTKSFEGRVPKTEYRLADEGRRALEAYLAHMETLIDSIRRG